MTYFDELLDHILTEVQVDDDTISEAKARRTAVLDAADTFTGVLRHYRAGSLAYGTAITPPPNRPNDKGVDGDGGIVLDRTVWTGLGPDSGAEEGPRNVVEDVKDHIHPTLREAHPDLTVGTTAKRAILVKFNEPLASGEDPPVELIVALNRKAGALWIPDLTRDGWDAADPIAHHRLINEDPKKSLRVRRARIMRLVKHWNKKYAAPAFSSFHLQALALEAVDDTEVGCQLRTSLERFFARAAESLGDAMTEDPAGVSGAFHLENGADRDIAVQRLEDAAAAIAAANANPENDETVRTELEKVFHPDTVEDAEDAREANALAGGNRSITVSAAGTVGARVQPRQPAATKRPAAWSRAE